MEKLFPRTLASLGALTEFVNDYLAANGIPGSGNTVNLIVEELFVNALAHGRGGGENIVLDLSHDKGGVTVSMTDFEVEPFDITKAPEADIQRSPEERTPGGLGIHLIRRLASEIRYDYRDRRSTITVRTRPED